MPNDKLRPEPAESARWLRFAWRLVAGTLAYNLVELAVALWAGIRAGSVALIGFGLDSGIEASAAILLLWRLAVEARGADEERVEDVERRVRRFVGLTFVALAIYVTVQSAWTLRSGGGPQESIVGIALAAVSLVVMPTISIAKLKAARALRSASLRAEAMETLACSYLSFTLLLGLAANMAAGWWWADPAAALLMVPWLLKEGVEGIRGEDECGG